MGAGGSSLAAVAAVVVVVVGIVAAEAVVVAVVWRRRCLAGKKPRVNYCTAVKTAYLRRRWVVETRFGRCA